MDKGSVNPATYLYSQGTGMGAPQFYGFAEIDMDYSQEPSEAERDRKKKERYQSILERCIVCKVCFKRMKDSRNKSLEQQPRNEANVVRRIGLIGHQRSVEQRSSLCHSHLWLSVHCHSAALATAFVLYTFVYFVLATSRYVVSLLRTAVRCIVIDCSVLGYTPKLLKVVEMGVGI